MYFSENVSEHLQVQGLEVQDSHNEIAKDLADVRHQAQDIHQKIGIRNVSTILNPSSLHGTPDQIVCLFLAQSDHSVLEFLQYQHQTSQYYSDVMNKLERMNSTLGSMLHYLDNMQRRVEERLHMIQGYLGWAGNTTDTHTLCLLLENSTVMMKVQLFLKFQLRNFNFILEIYTWKKLFLFSLFRTPQ